MAVAVYPVDELPCPLLRLHGGGAGSGGGRGGFDIVQFAGGLGLARRRLQRIVDDREDLIEAFPPEPVTGGDVELGEVGDMGRAGLAHRRSQEGGARTRLRLEPPVEDSRSDRARAEERRGGKEGESTVKSRWSPSH